MRFERGARVEVLIRKKNPEGVWLSGEVVADNKDSYTVRYFRGPYKKEVAEKLPVEAVRPRPPAIASPEVWNVGDYVEVFHDYCWKTSMILEDIEAGYYYIHVLGSIDEFRVRKSDIRVRQEWKEDKWVQLSKDSGICDDMFTKLFKKTQMQKQSDANVVQHVIEPVLKPKTLKRSPSAAGLYSDDDFAKSAHKRRAVKDKLEIRDSYSFIGKVEISSHQRDIWDKDYGQIFTKKYTSRDIDDFLARTLESGDCVSPMSSVASCSTTNDAFNDNRLLSHSSSSCSEFDDSLRSDAESLPRLRVEEDLDAIHSKEEYALRKHEIELSTYRFTLETFYAWGPLSWERVSLLTDLRSKLYVTDDEHLMELRRLKSIRNPGIACC